MTGLESIKTAIARAWKCRLATRRKARFENPFTDFLKRRREDAKSDSEKAQYLQTRWNEFDWGKAAECVTS